HSLQNRGSFFSEASRPFVNEGLLFFGKSVRLAGIKWYEEVRHYQQSPQKCFFSSHKWFAHGECSEQRRISFRLFYASRRRFEHSSICLLTRSRPDKLEIGRASCGERG